MMGCEKKSTGNLVIGKVVQKNIKEKSERKVSKKQAGGGAGRIKR